MVLDVVKLRTLISERKMSQTELAKTANLSRPTLIKLLTGNSAQVRPETARKLTAAFGLPDGSLDKDSLQTAYLARVEEQHRLLDFTGLGIVSQGAPMPMDRGFVPLSVQDRRVDEPRADDQRQRRKPFLLSSVLARSQCAALIGRPGSGKTTALRHAAWAYSKGCHADHSYPAERLIPVFVRLGMWAKQIQVDEQTDLFSAALSELGDNDEAGATTAWLEGRAGKGELLLLLDGLDEIPDPDLQGNLLERIRVFTRTYPETHLLITSRPIGFEAPKLGVKLDAYSVEDLSVASIRDFALEWCAFRHGHRSEHECGTCQEKMEALRHAILDHSGVRLLAGNPMMLTILCLLHEAGATLPQRRWQLYEKATEAFLFSWHQRKRAAMPGSPDKSLDLDDREILWILESLALEMQRQDLTLVSRWWVADHIAQVLREQLGRSPKEARAEADSLIWSLQARSGVFTEQGPDKFGFSHLAFQEHFAARAILAEDKPLDSLQDFLYHPRWHEVVRLVSAQLDRRQVPQLLRMILADPDPTGRFLRRGLLTVLACLADGAPLYEHSLLSDIGRETAELGGTKWLALPIVAMKHLWQLRSTRLRDFADEAIQSILRIAKKNLDERDCESLELGVRLLKSLDDPPDSDEADSDMDKVERPKRILELKRGALSLIVAEVPPEYDEAWSKEVLGQLDSDPSEAVRASCAEELGRFARSRAKVRRGLLRALDTEATPRVREAIAVALEDAATHEEVKRKLLQFLDQADDTRVQRACAEALGHVATLDKAVRLKLGSILTSDAETVIREGASSGLSECASVHEEVKASLLGIMKNTTEPASLRVACLRALQDVIPSLPEAMDFLKDSLSQSSADRFAGVAAQDLAEYVADGRVPWADLPIEIIEHVLVSLKEPCPHALHALRALVDARELRRLGVPLEARIGRALKDNRDCLQVAFIFGSYASSRQCSESDIDLMVIGDLSLRELTPGLKKAERELDRQINAVIYSEDEWRKRNKERNPFVVQVAKGKKIFVEGGCDELAAMAG